MNIITDLAQLRQPSAPLEFLTDKGPDSTEGNEIINNLLREILSERYPTGISDKIDTK